MPGNLGDVGAIFEEANYYSVFTHSSQAQLSLLYLNCLLGLSYAMGLGLVTSSGSWPWLLHLPVRCTLSIQHFSDPMVSLLAQGVSYQRTGCLLTAASSRIHPEVRRRDMTEWGKGKGRTDPQCAVCLGLKNIVTSSCQRYNFRRGARPQETCPGPRQPTQRVASSSAGRRRLLVQSSSLTSDVLEGP